MTVQRYRAAFIQERVLGLIGAVGVAGKSVISDNIPLFEKACHRSPAMLNHALKKCRFALKEISRGETPLLKEHLPTYRL